MAQYQPAMKRFAMVCLLAAALSAASAANKPRAHRMVQGSRTRAVHPLERGQPAHLGDQPFHGGRGRGLPEALRRGAAAHLQSQGVRPPGMGSRGKAGGLPLRRLHREAPFRILHVRDGDDGLQHHEHPLRPRCGRGDRGGLPRRGHRGRLVLLAGRLPLPVPAGNPDQPASPRGAAPEQSGAARAEPRAGTRTDDEVRAHRRRVL